MKRSGPPKRRTPLRADPQKQRDWERRSRRELKRSKPPTAKELRKLPNAGNVAVKPTRSSATYRAACKLVNERSGGVCEANVPEACPAGAHRAHHHHHVWLLSQGGPDADWNLLHVCLLAHRWIHDHVGEARERGLIRNGRRVA